jgi:hypothetical protein
MAVGNLFKNLFGLAGPTTLLMTLFGAQMALAALVAISGPKKVSISGPTPSNDPHYGFPPIQIHTSRPI